MPKILFHKNIPISGVAFNFPLSLDVNLKSHSAEGNTKLSVVVDTAQVAYMMPQTHKSLAWYLPYPEKAQNQHAEKVRESWAIFRCDRELFFSLALEKWPSFSTYRRAVWPFRSRPSRTCHGLPTNENRCQWTCICVLCACQCLGRECVRSLNGKFSEAASKTNGFIESVGVFSNCFVLIRKLYFMM